MQLGRVGGQFSGPSIAAWPPRGSEGRLCAWAAWGRWGAPYPCKGLLSPVWKWSPALGLSQLCHRWQAVSKTKNRQKEISWIWGEREEQISLALRLGEGKG